MKPKPITFTAFCSRVLHLRLTRGQHVLTQVALDGADPRDLKGADRDLARQMFGDLENISANARRILVLTLGRGSGKTTLAAAYALYVLLTIDVSSCGPGDVPVVVVIAPDKKTAGLSVRMALEMAKAASDISRLIESETSEGFTIRRPDGRLVAFESFAASRGGSSARGRSILTFVLDEAQFFRSDDAGAFVVNDRDIFNALIPRLMRGGKGVFLSTPWPVETLMGELFAKNFGHPTTALGCKGPTLLMRDNDPHTTELVASERERDPENSAREYDCDTSAVGSSGFFDFAAIDAALDPATLPLEHIVHHRYAAGVDFGFKSDASAIVVISFDGKYYRVADMLLRRPERGVPLKPSVVVAEFSEIAKRYGLTQVVADGFAREPLREALSAHGLGILDAPEGLNGKVAVYTRTRSVLHEGRLRLPNNQKLLAQLRSVMSRPTSGGNVSISSPRRAGLGHCDLVSALTLAVHHLAYASVTIQRPELVPGSPEWELARLKKEEEAMFNASVKKYGRSKWASWG